MDEKSFVTKYEQLEQELKIAKNEIVRLTRNNSRLERDKRFLALINKTTEQLFNYNEAQQNLRYLYNDLLLENCPNMIMCFDEELKFVIGTTVCFSHLGYEDAEQVKGLFVKDVFAKKIIPEWIEKLEQECHDVLSTLVASYYSEKIPYLDESFSYAQMVISPVIDDSKKCHGILIIINDITELTVTKEKAEAAAHSKSSFLANMSHEIRTPMNAIKGLSELLMLTELSSLQKDYVKNIVKSSNSLLSIINDILDFSKIDANKMDIMRSKYNLTAFLEEVTSVINLRAKDKDLLFIIDIEPTLPSVLLGDDVRLKQILYNILSNAVKYTKEGYFKLKVSGERIDGKLKLFFKVEDTGIGIKEEELPKLFEAFSRVDLHTNRSIMGTGLGLAISKRLLHAMDGDIEIKSTYGKGSVFTFWLLQEIVDDNPIIVLEKYKNEKVLLLDNGVRGLNIKNILSDMGVQYIYCDSINALVSASMPGLTHLIYSDEFDGEVLRSVCSELPHCKFIAIKNLRAALNQSGNNDDVIYEPVLISKVAAVLADASGVKATDTKTEFADQIEAVNFINVKALIVDDNEINLMVGGEMLRSYGISVDEADGGQIAIDMCSKEKYDIIFMDHMMPEIDGIEAAHQIRRTSKLNYETPIIALTANVVAGVHSQYLECGMNDFVSKPIEVEHLHQVLLKWLAPDKAKTQEKVSQVSTERKQDKQGTSFDLVATLDDFGMYASDVMQEIDGNLTLYIERLDGASATLAELTQKLKDSVRQEDWLRFSLLADNLKQLLFEIGARDCSGRAKNLVAAADSGNVEYINMDFFSLMDNMYILDKKLAVLVPLAKGKVDELEVLDNQAYIKICLIKMTRAFKEQKLYEAGKYLERLFSISLDKALDMQLLGVKKEAELGNYNQALKLCEELIELFC